MPYTYRFSPINVARRVHETVTAYLIEDAAIQRI